jgi:hypothetical protein
MAVKAVIGGQKIGQGRANKMSSRTRKALSHINRSMRILEIGASYNPLVPKADGWDNVHCRPRSAGRTAT